MDDQSLQTIIKKFHQLNTIVSSMAVDLTKLSQNMSILQKNVSELNQDVKQLKQDVSELKDNLENLRIHQDVMGKQLDTVAKHVTITNNTTHQRLRTLESFHNIISV